MKVQAEIRLRNAVVLEARKKRGWNQAQLAEAAGVSKRIVGAVECMQFRKSSVRDAVTKIATVLGLPTDEVLPAGMEEDVIHTVQTTREVDTEALLEYSGRLQSRLILSAPDEGALNMDDLKDKINLVLDKLCYREREVLKRRFGLCGEVQHTLAEVAKMFKVSRGRIMQIERHALNELRKPHLVYEFRDFAKERG